LDLVEGNVYLFSVQKLIFWAIHLLYGSLNIHLLCPTSCLHL